MGARRDRAGVGQPGDQQPAATLVEPVRPARRAAQKEARAMTPDKSQLGSRSGGAVWRGFPAAAVAELQAEVRQRVLEEFDRSVVRLPAEVPWQRIIKKGVVIMSHPVSRVVFGWRPC